MRRDLSAFLAPVRQFLDQIGVELPGQARNLITAGRIRTVASGAGGDIGVGDAAFEDFSSLGYELLWCAAEGRGV